MKNLYIKTKKNVQSISQLPLFFFLFVLAYCPVMGQSGPSKPLIQPKDYAMWHTLRFPQISGDGKWTSYQLDYEQAQDSLFVLDIKGKIKYDFPDAHSGQFEPTKKSKLFVFKDNTKGIGILNLNSGSTDWTKEAVQFEFSKDGRYLACYNPQKQNGYLKLIDLEKNRTTIINSVQNFNFDPKGNTALLITSEGSETKVELIQLNNMKRTVVTSSDGSEFLYPKWNDKGDAFVFMENNDNSKQRLYYFENSEIPVLKDMDDIDLRGLGNLEISMLDLSFSKDGERVFFWAHKKVEALNQVDADTVKVQVWKGSDKWIYPRQKLDWQYNKKDWVAVWWPKTKKVFQIGNPERPEVILTGDQKFAISYNILTYEPQNKQIPESDFYITNIETGENRLFVEQLESSWGYLTASPNGDYIAYFKEKKWWIYNIKKNKHIDASEGIPFSLAYKHAPHSVDSTPYGFVGWTTENELLVYDEFDVWKINANGRTPQCLTNGRESNIRFKAYNNLYEGFYSFALTFEEDDYNLFHDIIFITRDALFNYSYALRKPNGTIQPIFNETGKITELRKAKYADSYIYLKEKNNEPPAIWKKDGKKNNVLIQLRFN